MSYLISLREQLRAVTREVFLHDPYFERIDWIQTNKHARIFLRHIIQRARNPPFNLRISIQQLARLIGSSRTSIFLQWFRYNVRLPAEFRRARWFLNEMILLNAEEDLRPFRDLLDLDVEPIREARRVEGSPIKNVTDALEAIGWMQDAFLKQKRSGSFSSSSSSEHGSETDSFGEDPNEERNVKEVTPELQESHGLIGRPDIITKQQLLDQFGKMLIVSNESDDISNDNELIFSGVHDLSNQQLYVEDGVSIYYYE